MNSRDDFMYVLITFFISTIEMWTKNKERPASGSLVQLITKDNVTVLKVTQ